MGEQPMSLRNTEDDEPIAVGLGEAFEKWARSKHIDSTSMCFAHDAWTAGRNDGIDEARAERGMSPQEILELLSTEFPNQYTCLSLLLFSHSSGTREVKMTISHEDVRSFTCTSVREGIRLLRVNLGREVEPAVGVNIRVPA